MSKWTGSGRGRGGRPWRRKREEIFIRDKFLCQLCLLEGRITPVELHGKNHGVCDHKKPVAQGGDDSNENLQTICQDCDEKKTLSEAAHGAGRSVKNYSNEVGDDGWPLDPKHPANACDQQSS